MVQWYIHLGLCADNSTARVKLIETQQHERWGNHSTTASKKNEKVITSTFKLTIGPQQEKHLSICQSLVQHPLHYQAVISKTMLTSNAECRMNVQKP